MAVTQEDPRKKRSDVSFSHRPRTLEEITERAIELRRQVEEGKKPKPPGKKPKPPKPVLIKGKCSACRRSAVQAEDGRTYHKQGTFKEGESCPSGSTAVKEEETDPLFVLIGLGKKVLFKHHEAEVEIPDYCFFSDDLINSDD